MARPSEYNPDLCDEICDRIMMGENIKAVLDSDKRFPSFPTWCKWKRENIELFNQYIGAIQDKSESVLAKIDEYLQQVLDGDITYKQASLLINTLKWKAAKFYPKMFGTNSTIDLLSDGKAIQQQVTVFRLPDNNRDNVEVE